jgi:hypothetical protein
VIVFQPRALETFRYSFHPQPRAENDEPERSDAELSPTLLITTASIWELPACR